MNQMKELEPIIKYKMNKLEAKAYKVALIWIDEFKRELPKERCIKLNKSSDPRKTNIFKYCYKLIQETKGILKDSEIQLYVRAQIQILKAIREGDIHALIEPKCLVGDKAWKRWKLWKSKYLRKLGRIQSSDELGIKTKTTKVLAEIKHAFVFLEERSLLDFDSFSKNKERIKKFINNGEISCFYALLSPWVSKLIDLKDFDFDKVYCRSSINPKIEEFFRNMFSHEFE